MTSSLEIFVEDPELGAGEDINRKADFLLVDPPYNLQKDWADSS